MTYENLNLHVRKCTEFDVGAILDLQESVVDGLVDPTWLRVNTEKTFMRCVAEPNVTFGIFDGDTLVAIGIMEDAAGRNDDIGLYVQNHEIHDHVDAKLFLVRERYRGMGLQRYLIGEVERVARDRGYAWLCASVSPKNLFSKRNLLSCGFEYDCTQSLYGGLTRDVLVKRIDRPQSVAT